MRGLRTLQVETFVRVREIAKGEWVSTKHFGSMVFATGVMDTRGKGSVYFGGEFFALRARDHTGVRGHHVHEGIQSNTSFALDYGESAREIAANDGPVTQTLHTIGALVEENGVVMVETTGVVHRGQIGDGHPW